MAMSNIKPYQFEPIASAHTDIDCTSSEDEEDVAAGEGQSRVSDWCICEHCEEWPQQKEDEKICCRLYSEIEDHLEEDQMCITSHEGMAGNCLSRFVIDSTIVLIKQLNMKKWREDYLQTEPHKTYRHVAYCNFVRWIWRKTGKKNRKILPACVVAAISKKFPSEEFASFKYAL
ncbi:P2X purinoceptor 7-like [Pomacea canaliculata]|uniref:P2X purinoceptor 7-like n=1 Tax=Pomacea canaliculata TaxID=400727 RepID=UPI000D72D64F|nr:P2X purinoceptor 7-like [Pomacea canaliculata]